MMILCGCSQTDNPENADSDGKISVVCTTFPQYDWVRQILGSKSDDMNLTLLLNSGVDLHNYQPTVDDILKISTCDLFIYVGGESNQWVDGALAEAINPNMIVINLLDTLGDGAKAEEIIEGMEEDGGHDDHDDEEDGDYDGHDDEEDGYYDDHDEEDDYEDSYEDKAEIDAHIWLSLKNAEVLCTHIENALSSLDADNTREYQSNLEVYTEKSRVLDAEYQTAVNDASVSTLLFGDRFPFRYLMDDYGLEYYAAFSGCSAETEAGFDTIVFLAEKTDELGLNTIMVTESADQSIAKAIIRNTTDKNQKILVLDAMQSVTAGSVENGATYISIMESNLTVLKKALQ